MPEVVSSIVSVVVYPDRARVTRRATVELPQGLSRVGFPGLPLNLDADSLRGGARGSAKSRLLGVSLQRVASARTPVEVVLKLESEIETLEDRDRLLLGEDEALAAASDRVERLAEQSESLVRGYALAKVGIEAHRALFDFVEGKLRAGRERRVAIAAERRELAREIARRRREHQALSSQHAPDRNRVEVEIEASAAGSFTVDVIYVVPGAAWTPLYDLRLNGSLVVAYLASVRQDTGEEWKDVELSLSTAFPARNLILPEPQPWMLRPLTPPPIPQPRAAGPVGAAAPMMAAASMPPEEEAEELSMEADFLSAEIQTTGAAVSYTLAGRADVPSDGTPRKVAIGQFEIPPEVDHVMAPGILEAAYRRLTVRNESSYMLLAGRAQIFEGEEYLGVVEVEAAAPGGTWELSLGVDERVRVKRTLVLDETDKKLLGDVRRIRRAYEIEIENLVGAPVRAVVRDRIPVSKHEAIRVRLESSKPKPDESELGVLEWRFGMADRAKENVNFEFVVEHPRDMLLPDL